MMKLKANKTFIEEQQKNRNKKIRIKLKKKIYMTKQEQMMKLKINKIFIKTKNKMVQKCILLLESNIYVWREIFSSEKKRKMKILKSRIQLQIKI